MMCAKDLCRIYRDKKYCSRAERRDGMCKCRHAVNRCDVGVACGFADRCPIVTAKLDRKGRV